MKLGLWLSLFGGFASGAITSITSSRYTAYANLKAGVSNSLTFDYTGTLLYGEFIGVFPTGTNCANIAAGTYPILEIMPSAALSNTKNSIPASESPQMTSSFGSLPTTSGFLNYELCYCPLSASGCTYSLSAGELEVIDIVPKTFAFDGAVGSKLIIRFAAGSSWQFPTVSATSERVMVIDATGQCGVTGVSTAWDGTNLAGKSDITYNSDTGASLPVLVGGASNGNSIVQTATNTQNAVAAGNYKICLCLGTCMGNGGVATDPMGASSFKYEVGSIFVSDLKFHDSSSVLVLPKNAAGATLADIAFTYSSPSALVANEVGGFNYFWLMDRALSCGDGSQTVASSNMTLAYKMPSTYFVGQNFTKVDVSALNLGNSLYRVCYSKRTQMNVAPTVVYDMSNVGLRLLDLVITALQPFKVSDGTTQMHLSWSSALKPGDKVFFAKQGTCQAQPAGTAAGATLSDTVTVGFPGLYYFTFSAITAAVSRTLFTTCVLPAGSASSTATDNIDLGLVVAPADVTLFIPRQGDAANEKRLNVVTNGPGVNIAIDISLSSGWTPTADLLWFRKASSPCGEMQLGQYANDATFAVGLAAIAAAGTAVDQTFDFSPISDPPTNELFRLCVYDDVTKKVYDFPNAAVLVQKGTDSPTPFYVRPTSAPVYSVTSIPFQVFERGAYATAISQNNWPGLNWKFTGSLTKGDLLGFLPVVGSVDGAANKYVTCGEDTNSGAEFWTLASQSNDFGKGKGQELSGDVPGSMPAGRYLVCYCNSGWNGNVAELPPRDCGLTKNWDMFVGFYTVRKADPAMNQVAQSPYTAAAESLIELRVDDSDFAKDKIMLVPAGSPCGTDRTSTGANINIFTVTGNYVNGVGYTGFSFAGAIGYSGHFDICYCRAKMELDANFAENCPTVDYTFGSSTGRWFWSYGAKIGTIALHDLKMVSTSAPVEVLTYAMSVSKSSGRIKFSYTQGIAAGQLVWFARTDTVCDRSRAGTSNATSAIPLPQSKSDAVFSFSSLTGPSEAPCTVQWRLCSNDATGLVSMEYPDIRIVFAEAAVGKSGQAVGGVTTSFGGRVVTATAGATAGADLTLSGGCDLTLGVRTHFWFEQADKACGTTLPNAAADGTVSLYLITVETATATFVDQHWVDGDFQVAWVVPAGANGRRPFRLCACQQCGVHAAGANVASTSMDYSKTYTKARFWDFPSVLVYPVKTNSAIFLTPVTAAAPSVAITVAASMGSIASMVKDQIVEFTAGAAGGVPMLLSGDVLWFRSVDNECGTGAADGAQGGLGTASPEVTYAATFAPGGAAGQAVNQVKFDFSALQTNNKLYRLCIRTFSTNYVFDMDTAVLEYDSGGIFNPVPAPAVTKRPTMGAPTVQPVLAAAAFTPHSMTITPGGDTTQTRSFEFVVKKLSTTSSAIAIGDRLGFLSVKEGTGIQASCSARQTTDKAFFETTFVVASAVSTAVELKVNVPRLPEGVYYVCFCRKGVKCGDGFVWDANGDVGILNVVDADIEQTITPRSTEMYETTALFQQNYRIGLNYNPSFSTKLGTVNQVVTQATPMAITTATITPALVQRNAALPFSCVMFHKIQTTITQGVADGQVYGIKTASASTPALDLTTGGVTADVNNAAGITAAGGYFTYANDNIYITAKDKECGTAGFHSAATGFYASFWHDRGIHFTTQVAADKVTAVGRYSVCYCRKSTLLAAVGCPATTAAGATLNQNYGMYGRVGHLVVSDLTFQFGNMLNDWKCDTTSCNGVTPAVTRAAVTYTGTLFPAGSLFWFLDAGVRCQTGAGNSIKNLGTVPLQIPTSLSNVNIDFNFKTVGRHYRVCIQSPVIVGGVSTLQFTDLDHLSAVVTDVVVTPKAPILQRYASTANPKAAFQVDVSSAVSLTIGDYFWFQANEMACQTHNWGGSSANSFGFPILLDKASSVQRWTGSGRYQVETFATSTAGKIFNSWRLCARRTTIDDATGGSSHMVMDLGSKDSTIVPMRKIALSPNVLENAQSVTLSVTTPDAFAAGDQFWFRQVGAPCLMDVLSGTSVVADSTFGTLSASPRFNLAAQPTAQTRVVDLRTSQVNTKYRLCVQLASSSTPASDVLDVDTTVVEVQKVLRAPTMPPQNPTPVMYNVVPTPAGAVVADRFQSFTFNAVTYAGAVPRVLNWKFPGTAHPQDALAVLPKGNYFCNGQLMQKDPAVMISAANASASGSIFSAPVPPMKAGKYVLCFCHAASSVAGCNHKSGFVQQVGFVTFFDSDTNQTSSVSLWDPSSGFSVTLGHVVALQDRVMLIADGGVCGETQPHAINSALTNVIPTIGTGATANVLTYGAFAKTVSGTFSVCYCNSAYQRTGTCSGNTNNPEYLPSFGGKIATLIIEDVKLNGRSYLSVTQATPELPVKVTQTIYRFNLDRVWLAKGTPTPCGTGTHSASSTLTAPVFLQESMVFNFKGMAASSDLWRLCILNPATSAVTSLSSVGFFFTDVGMDAKYIAPVTGTNTAQNIILTHPASFASNANSYFYFLHEAKSCYTAVPSNLASFGSGVTDSDTSSMESIATSGSTYAFQFTYTQAKRRYRLCAGLTSSTVNGVKVFAAAVDFGTVKVNPRPNLFDMKTFGIRNVSSSPVIFSNPITAQGLVASDTVWFRREDKACESVPPTGATADTYSIPSFPYNLTANVDASKVELSSTYRFRVCAKVATGEVLDWIDIKMSVVSLTSATPICNKGNCYVVLNWDGYLTTGSPVWFQSTSTTTATCIQPPGASSSTSSGLTNLGPSGYTYTSYDFSNTQAGPSAPLRLCLKQGLQIYDFPAITVLVSSVALTPMQYTVTPQTGEIEATAAAKVNLTYESSDFPAGSSLWWKPKGSECMAHVAGANASSAVSPPVQGGAQALTFDFSMVTTSAKGGLAEWTACMGYQSKIFDLGTVTIKLFRFFVDVSAVDTQAAPITILPRSPFGGFYFRLSTMSCTPVPSYSAAADNSTTNRGYPSADTNSYDFSKAAKGTTYRLCAEQINNSPTPATYDFSHIKVDVSCPDGKVGVGCTQCKTGNFASKASPLTCTSCATPCNGNAVSCSPAANNTVTCQCSGDFDPATACLNCKAGFLKSGALCVATKTPTATPSASPTSPTAAPTAVPTAAPTAVPTAVPTPARACSQSDAAQYAGKCSNWAKQGYCTKGDYVAFMTQNCAQSCCCQPSIKADNNTQCPGWATAGYCNGEFKDWMGRECASSCFSVNAGENPNCHGWAAQGYCVKYSDWMASNNFCQTSCSKDSCTYAEQCPAWARKGFCTTTYADFMSVNCLGSCKA